MGDAETDRVVSGVRGGSGEMFDRIAGRYDFVNRVISLGLDQRWRRAAVRALRLGDAGGRVLDLATGTGDLALAIAAAHPSATVVGSDPSTGMLEVGRGKVTARSLDPRVRLEEGDAQALPYADDSFDGLTMAFGIRNVPSRARALAEMRRVLRPGARAVVLELTEPEGRVLGAMARFHVHGVVPRAGALLSGSEEYRYLEKSIRAFPKGTRFADELAAAGFADVTAEPLLLGVAHLFVGVAP